MTLADKTVLVTGANRGLGQALVSEALDRDAARVYAAARQPFTHPDPRVTTVVLDITDAGQIQGAAEAVADLDILVNNAGWAAFDDLSDRAVLEQHLAVNLFGPYAVTQAFLPALLRSGGAIVNIVSTASLATVPVIASYSVSKAAAFSLSQTMRGLLASRGVAVHSVLPGPIDTDMARDLDIPKTSPRAVAEAVFDGVAKGEEEIFPDPAAQALAADWHTGAVKSAERDNAALLAMLAMLAGGASE
jgi:NAD(P)-dependent dehydrogenase (short-subunit alcohol dehydrogenase family)